MTQLFRFLSFLLNIYMMVLFVRILLTWFPGMGTGRLQEILGVVTDPYLNWFRRFDFLKVANLDLSPVVALGVLSLVNRVINTLAAYGTISLGIILAMIVQAVWGAVSFFLSFLIIVIVLRFIAHLMGRNSTGRFWRVVDTISRPVIFRINNLVFKDRIMTYGTSILFSIGTLIVSFILFSVLVSGVTTLLEKLPI